MMKTDSSGKGWKQEFKGVFHSFSKVQNLFVFHSSYVSVTFSLEQIIKAKMSSHNMFVMQWSRHGDSLPSFFFSGIHAKC